MTDFLLELRSEEIPARMQPRAAFDLEQLYLTEMSKWGFALGGGGIETTTYHTPRRLALIARNVPDATQAVSEEIKGPRTSAPAQALEGFLRKTGARKDELIERDGVWFAAVNEPSRPTADVLAEAIPAIVRAFPWPKSMRWGDASRSTESLRWVRPLQGIVALFGDQLVPCAIAGIESGAATVGHRFHHPGIITIGSAADYVEKLRACHVIVDQAERRTLIRDRAAALAAEAGLELIEDEGLVTENAGLTEWPVPLLGRFDEAFLDVPPEVIQLTARVNQKYFVCRIPSRNGEGNQPQAGGGAGKAGALANAFVCTANIAASDDGVRIVEGNRKVLAARLSDARFFYETDLKVKLEDQAKKLEQIVFHEKLGTVADKVDRVAKLARWLVEEGVILPGTGRGTSEAGGGGLPQATPPVEAPLHHQPAASGLPPLAGEDLADLAERAARLAKADLVTGMVGEFPELQGLMGGYYAAAQAEHPAVAAAIRDHYKPIGPGDDVPTDPVTMAVSLADKLDTLVAFFVRGMPPTGSKDPFALRRAALGVISTIVSADLRLRLQSTVRQHARHFTMRQSEWPSAIGYADRDKLVFNVAALGVIPELYVEQVKQKLTTDAGDKWAQSFGKAAFANIRAGEHLLDFFADRFKVQQREAGVRHDLIDAVFAAKNPNGVGEDDLVRLLARVHALQAFVGTPDGANLLAGYKRASNILKKEGFEASAPRSVTPANAGVSLDRTGQEPQAAPASAGATREAAGGGYTPEPAEYALRDALDTAAPAAAAAVACEDFAAAMAALASLRAPIDTFFETVIVNDPDPAKRAARLHLLARVREAVHGVADFSRIEG